MLHLKYIVAIMQAMYRNRNNMRCVLGRNVQSVTEKFKCRVSNPTKYADYLRSEGGDCGLPIAVLVYVDPALCKRMLEFCIRYVIPDLVLVIAKYGPIVERIPVNVLQTLQSVDIRSIDPSDIFRLVEVLLECDCLLVHGCNPVREVLRIAECGSKDKGLCSRCETKLMYGDDKPCASCVVRKQRIRFWEQTYRLLTERVNSGKARSLALYLPLPPDIVNFEILPALLAL